MVTTDSHRWRGFRSSSFRSCSRFIRMWGGQFCYRNSFSCRMTFSRRRFCSCSRLCFVCVESDVLSWISDGLLGAYIGLLVAYIGRAGRGTYDGLVTEYSGLTGRSVSTMTESSVSVGKYDGLVGDYDGEVGLVSSTRSISSNLSCSSDSVSNE
jgi:hypothetical protein